MASRRATALLSSTTRRHLSNSFTRSVRSTTVPSFKATLLASAIVAASLAYVLKPEWAPSLPELQAEAPPNAEDQYLDPTTKTPFPHLIESPSGTLRLIGTGVRVVSFLSVQVYSIGFYVDEKTLSEIKQGKIEGWENYTVDHLLAPYKGVEGIKGEFLIEKLMERPHDIAVIISPMRSTSLPHLRDGFSRALVARLKMPHVASALSPEESEGAADAITELKSFFPKRPLAKGEPLFVYYSGTDVSARFVIKNEDASNFNLGASHNAVLTRQLFLSYFSDVGVISEELKQSVARGFAGEPR